TGSKGASLFHWAIVTGPVRCAKAWRRRLRQDIQVNILNIRDESCAMNCAGSPARVQREGPQIPSAQTDLTGSEPPPAPHPAARERRRFARSRTGRSISLPSYRKAPWSEADAAARRARA